MRECIERACKDEVSGIKPLMKCEKIMFFFFKAIKVQRFADFFLISALFKAQSQSWAVVLKSAHGFS